MRLVNYTTTFIDYPCKDHWANIFYFSGCNHNCPDCHNLNIQNPNIGEEIDSEKLYKIVKRECKKNLTNKVVFSGGDPLSPFNIDVIRDFLNIYGNEFDVVIYTGYGIKYVKENKIKNFKFIKCGIFDKQRKQESGNFENYFQLASANQNLYNNNYEQVSINGRLIYEKCVKD